MPEKYNAPYNPQIHRLSKHYWLFNEKTFVISAAESDVFSQV